MQHIDQETGWSIEDITYGGIVWRVITSNNQPRGFIFRPTKDVPFAYRPGSEYELLQEEDLIAISKLFKFVNGMIK